MKYFTILLAMIAALGLAACQEEDKASDDSKGEMSDTAKTGGASDSEAKGEMSDPATGDDDSGDAATMPEDASSSEHPNAGRYVDAP